jgi:hypothetical protein
MKSTKVLESQKRPNTACTGQVRAFAHTCGDSAPTADSASGDFVRQIPPLPVTPAVSLLRPKNTKKVRAQIMQEIVFKPKYPPQLTFGSLVFIPIEFYILWQIFSGKDASPENIFGAVFFGLLLIILPFAYIKRMVFRANNFSIEKFILPTKTIEYSDVTDVGAMALKTRNGDLSLRTMVNSDELSNIFAGLIEQGKINRHQLENKVDSRAMIFRKAIKPAGIISLALWVVMFFVFPYKDSFFRDISLVGFFLPVYVVVYQVLKNRADNQ